MVTNHLRFFPSLALLGCFLFPGVDLRAGAAEFAVEGKTDRLVITDGGRPVACYVFSDDKILRPYFAGVHAPGGIQVTRNHPPVPGADATDHDSMHPGIWLAFGDIDGHDFWRNRARIVHERFVEAPAVRDGRVAFTAVNALQAPGGERICRQTSRLTLAARPSGYLLIWDATFVSDGRDLVFGDQEEMGLGVRVATGLTEKDGGVIRNSLGAEGAKAGWGRIADWSDCSGTIGGRRAGILLMPDPKNFRPSWFHVRDYGLMVANPFGRNAFTGGEKSAVVVKAGEPFRLRFGVLIHAAPPDGKVNLEAEYEHFKGTLAEGAAAFFPPSRSAKAPATAYDPLEVPENFTAEALDLTVLDSGRKREIPIRVFLPSEKAQAPVVLFSHGLGGSREGCAYLGRHWSARGYVAVFVQHPGSDDAVWRGTSPSRRMEALRKAAGMENFLLRVKDVPAVIDRLERWSGTGGHPLEGRLDTKRLGFSGHSFGALTTQAVCGQSFPLAGRRFTDDRIGAAIALSPSGPRNGGDPRKEFGDVKIPWMLMTGTKDISPIGDADMASRLSVFPALSPGGKYELVLEGAEHSAFTDRALPGDREKRNPNHHRAILALSTAFWDAFLRDDGAAREWLDGDGPLSVLEKGDRWQRK